MPLDDTVPGVEAVTGLGLSTRGCWERPLEGIHLLFGRGALGELGRLASELGGRRVLLVSDPGITACGYCATALDSLAAAGLEPRLFDAVEENPTDRNAEQGARVARQHRADLLVGLGGGSAMDCAKAINFLVSGGGELAGYEGFGRAGCEMLPSIGVPTTAGTGSEAQSYALVTSAATHRKMACGDPGARFRTVILDPVLPGSQPPRTAAAASLDALSHAVESFVTRARGPASAALSLEAWRLLDANLPQALRRPSDGLLWGAMQIGAFLAGAAIERSMLGAAHSLANPLTATYGTTHGVAVSLMLPNVVRYNGEAVAELYAELVPGADDPTEGLAGRLEALRSTAGLPATLREAGVPAADRERLGELAWQASEQWTLRFNPRPATAADLRGLYERTF
jgi:alcohol dehydrogenase